MNVDMALTYLDFVVDRHRVWEQRQENLPGPWSDDPILQTRKFTNVYRVLDHGSQFLLKELLQTAGTPDDALARAFLYRMTNRPQVWEQHYERNGFYPYAADMTPALADLWCAWRDKGLQVFSGAYIIMPEPGVLGVDKVRSVIKLAENMFAPGGKGNIVQRFLDAPTMAARYKVLHAQPGIGPFIAMQVLTDFGYSPFGADQDENSFVIAGPGSRKGAAEVDPKRKAENMIRWAREQLLALDDCPMLEGRPPSLMDVQNTFCEFSKYARYMRKPTPARLYPPAHPGAQPRPVLPAHWAYSAASQ